MRWLPKTRRLVAGRGSCWLLRPSFRGLEWKLMAASALSAVVVGSCPAHVGDAAPLHGSRCAVHTYLASCHSTPYQRLLLLQ